MKANPRRKGQVALEYLTTYGFALLAMLVTVGVINYLGFFNPSTLRANECSFPTGFSCQDYVMRIVGNERVEFILTNLYGVNVTINEVTMSINPASRPGPSVCTTLPPAVWASGTNKTFTCILLEEADYVPTQRYDAVLLVNFSQQGGAYTHVVAGTVSTIAQ